MSIVLVYVDDLIFTGDNDYELKRVISKFITIFDGKLFDELSWYLGVRLECSEGVCKISQSVYVQHMLTNYGLENMRVYDTPMAASFYEDLQSSLDQPVEGIEEYQSMIRALIYLSNRSRPDICTAVGILSRYVSNPNKFLLAQLKRVFGYLQGTPEIGINVKKKPNLDLIFSCDSDFAGNKTDRKSRTGWIGMLAGSPVTWASHKHSCTAISTHELNT